VNELADKPSDFSPAKHKQVEYIIPLAEMIAEAKNVKSTSSKSVQEEYFKMIVKLGNEFSILRGLPISDIKEAGFEQMSEGIKRMREGNVIKKPGYDGIFGVIKVFDKSILQEIQSQVGMKI
jgi:PHP family Zn ribbon phosphoesterase